MEGKEETYAAGDGDHRHIWYHRLVAAGIFAFEDRSGERIERLTSRLVIRSIGSGEWHC